VISVIAKMLRTCLVLLLAGLLGATLILLAPGYDADERALDSRLSSSSLNALRGKREASRPLAFYGRYLAGVARGDLGISRVYNQPVAQLVNERIGVTANSAGAGLLLGWCAGLAVAMIAALRSHPAVTLASAGLSATLLSVPSALLAIVCLIFELPTAVAIAGVVFPRVFSHAYGQLCSSREMPHVVIARASGIRPFRTFCFHLVPPVMPAMIALGGVTVPLALGASIPVEALGDAPGIGQLAWRAALGRDLPVLVSVTLILTAVTALANLASDVAASAMVRRSR
jgi:peptide/nickel transport system permease protein